MADFEKYDNMCGGFIWDFVDQALHRKAQDGTDLWLYGTDFEKEEPRHWYSLPNTTAITGSNTYFCANGLSVRTARCILSITRCKRSMLRCRSWL